MGRPIYIQALRPRYVAAYLPVRLHRVHSSSGMPFHVCYDRQIKRRTSAVTPELELALRWWVQVLTLEIW